jgi:hypothetical protein
MSFAVIARSSAAMRSTLRSTSTAQRHVARLREAWQLHNDPAASCAIPRRIRFRRPPRLRDCPTIPRCLPVRSDPTTSSTPRMQPGRRRDVFARRILLRRLRDSASDPPEPRPYGASRRPPPRCPTPPDAACRSLKARGPPIVLSAARRRIARAAEAVRDGSPPMPPVRGLRARDRARQRRCARGVRRGARRARAWSSDCLHDLRSRLDRELPVTIALEPLTRSRPRFACTRSRWRSRRTPIARRMGRTARERRRDRRRPPLMKWSRTRSRGSGY